MLNKKNNKKKKKKKKREKICVNYLSQIGPGSKNIDANLKLLVLTVFCQF